MVEAVVVGGSLGAQWSHTANVNVLPAGVVWWLSGGLDQHRESFWFRGITKIYAQQRKSRHVCSNLEHMIWAYNQFIQVHFFISHSYFVSSLPLVRTAELESAYLLALGSVADRTIDFDHRLITLALSLLRQPPHYHPIRVASELGGCIRVTMDLLH
jgi:hypothetical protein